MTSSIVISDTRLDTPNELIGFFGKDREHCRAYHRRSEGVVSFTHQSYNFCSLSGCQARVVSHERTRDGFILNVRSPVKTSGWKERIRLIANNDIEISTVGFDKKAELMTKCTADDAIAGIGRRSESFHLSGMKPIDNVYAALYAAAVPLACPQLRVIESGTDPILLKAVPIWINFKRKNGSKSEPGLSTLDSARRSLLLEKQSAEMAVRADASTVEDFCERALERFGGKSKPALLEIAGRDS